MLFCVCLIVPLAFVKCKWEEGLGNIYNCCKTKFCPVFLLHPHLQQLVESLGENQIFNT